MMGGRVQEELDLLCHVVREELKRGIEEFLFVQLELREYVEQSVAEGLSRDCSQVVKSFVIANTN
jgi:hypothetical protein